MIEHNYDEAEYLSSTVRFTPRLHDGGCVGRFHAVYSLSLTRGYRLGCTNVACELMDDVEIDRFICASLICPNDSLK